MHAVTHTELPGERVVLECSNCNKPLVDIRSTNPDQPFLWKVKAKCCYCGDSSFEKEIRGLIKYFGAQVPKDGDSSEVVVVTRIAHLEADGEKVLFHTAPGDKP